MGVCLRVGYNVRIQCELKIQLKEYRVRDTG